MNYLGYFWDPLNGYAEQHDYHEGIVLATDSSHADSVLGDSVLREYAASVPMFRAEGYKYCNVACFNRVDVKTFPTYNHNMLLHWQEYANMKEFGEFVVIIKDVDELMKRVNAAVQRENFKYCAGDVEYYNNTEPYAQSMVLQIDPPFDLRNMPEGRKFDSFCKEYKYKDQNEWRISLYRGVKEEKQYTLNVGSLDDIACLTDIRHMTSKFNLLLGSGAVRHNWDYGYRGNATRDELRDLFIALEDYRANMSLTVKMDILSKLPPTKRGDFLERFNRKVSDVIRNFNSGVMSEEDFYAEIKRLQSVLERNRISMSNKGNA